MFIIRDAQVNAFEKLFLNKLKQKCFINLQEELPDIFMRISVKEIMTQIDKLFLDIPKMKIKYENNILLYVYLCFRYKENYTSMLNNIKIRKILNCQEYHENEKIYLVQTELDRNSDEYLY